MLPSGRRRVRKNERRNHVCRQERELEQEQELEREQELEQEREQEQERELERELELEQEQERGQEQELERELERLIRSRDRFLENRCKFPRGNPATRADCGESVGARSARRQSRSGSGNPGTYCE